MRELVVAAVVARRRTVTGNELLDWPLERQPWIERSLANRHLRGGNTLSLNDVLSSYLEGRRCPLATFDHNCRGKRGKTRVTDGLHCAADGGPVAVEVFAGNAGDPSTVTGQVAKVRSRFGIGYVALAGDRGMLTTVRIREDLEPAGLTTARVAAADDLASPPLLSPSAPGLVNQPPEQDLPEQSKCPVAIGRRTHIE